MAPLDELKRLSPQERIAKLKELEEARKREIDEARSMLTETVRELVDEAEEKEKIPVEQLRAVDESTLLTAEDRELFRMKRFGKAKPGEAAEAKSPEKPDGAFETTEEREQRLEEIAKHAPRMAVKQYGSALSTVLDDMHKQYLNPHAVVEDAASILHNTAYNREMSEEEKWRTYGDAKSLLSVLEQSGAPSEEIKYAANAVAKFVDRMKMHYRT